MDYSDDGLIRSMESDLRLGNVGSAACRIIPVNMTELSRDLGLAVNTVKAWLSVLEATYQVIVLRPYFAL